MKSIDIMIEEHEYVRRMLKVIRKYCYKVLLDEEIDYGDFYKIIDFIRNYTDSYHHSKEEDILFKAMAEKMPKLINNGPITGMLIEHDMARLYVSNLEKALEKYEEGDDESRLDIIANAISYTDLLERHIEKENSAIFKFANSILTEDVKKKVDEECDHVDLALEDTGVQRKYLSLLVYLEEKVKK